MQCVKCGKGFAAKRATAQYCSAPCRVAAHRKRDGADTPAPGGDVHLVSVPAGDDLFALSDAAVDPGVVIALTDQLRAAGKLNTVVGQLAVILAKRLQESAGDTGAAVAALSRELDRLTAILLADVQAEPDAIDEAQATVIQLRNPKRRRRNLPSP